MEDLVGAGVVSNDECVRLRVLVFMLACLSFVSRKHTTRRMSQFVSLPEIAPFFSKPKPYIDT